MIVSGDRIGSRGSKAVQINKAVLQLIDGDTQCIPSPFMLLSYVRFRLVSSEVTSQSIA